MRILLFRARKLALIFPCEFHILLLYKESLKLVRNFTGTRYMKATILFHRFLVSLVPLAYATAVSNPERNCGIEFGPGPVVLPSQLTPAPSASKCSIVGSALQPGCLPHIPAPEKSTASPSDERCVRSLRSSALQAH